MPTQVRYIIPDEGNNGSKITVPFIAKH